MQFYFWIKRAGCLCVLPNIFSDRPPLRNLNYKLMKPSKMSDPPDVSAGCLWARVPSTKPFQIQERFWKNSNIAWLFIIVQFYYWVKCIGCFSARPLQKLVKPSKCQIHLMFLKGVYDYMSDPMRHSTAHQNSFRNKCDCQLKCFGDRKCQKQELGAHNIFSAST